MANQKQATRDRRNQNTSHPQKVATLHANRWKTMTQRFDYESDLAKAFLDQNHRRMIQLFERLGMIMKTVKQDATAYRKVMDWHNNINLAIANEQIETLEEQLEQAANQKETDNITINTPDDYYVEFQVSHPVAKTIITALSAVDKLAARIEKAFYEQRIDDLQLEDSRRQTMKVMNGVLDRINKVTSPGKRKDDSGRFSTNEYFKFLKDPNTDLLEYTDMPYSIRQRLGLIDEEAEPEKVTEEPTKQEPKAQPEKKKKAAKKAPKEKAEAE